MPEFDQELDACGLNCPLPILRAKKTLGKMNLFALGFRTNNMETPAGRAKKIAALVEMLERGETIVP